MPSSYREANSSSRRIIIGTTVILGGASIILIFAPTEVARWIGAQRTGPRFGVIGLLIQLYGAALFGLAMTGWTIRNSVVGGVFGRSYVVGNAGHAFVGALTLVRPAMEGGASSVLKVTAAVYWLLAVVFGYLTFVAAPRS